MYNLEDRRVTDIEVTSPKTIRITYSDNKIVSATRVIFSTHNDTNTGVFSVNFYIEGSGSGLGLSGFQVSPDNPVKLAGVETTNIDDVTNYLIQNL